MFIGMVLGIMVAIATNNFLYSLGSIFLTVPIAVLLGLKA